MESETDEIKYLNDVIKVKELNRRQLGKIILKYCGNEGCENTEQQASLRRLLQAAIDYLPKEKQQLWLNAEFTVYDVDANSYRIQSGNAQNRFMVKYSYLTKDIMVKKVSKESYCVVA